MDETTLQVHQWNPEDVHLSHQEIENVKPSVRKSARQKKPSPKYADVALAKEESITEQATFEEVAQDKEWKAMEAEIQALNQNQT